MRMKQLLDLCCRILENNNLHQISPMTFSGLNSLVLLWVFSMYIFLCYWFFFFFAAMSFLSPKFLILKSIINLSSSLDWMHLFTLFLTDFQGSAEQLFDQVGWHLSRHAKTELAVSTTPINESCLVLKEKCLSLTFSVCVCVCALFITCPCSDLEGNLIETIGNASLRSCSMLTVL